METWYKLIKKLNNILKLLLLFGLLYSQSTQNPVTITASVESPARAGEVVNIKINADMEDQWHIYSIYKLTEGPLPTEITVNSSVVGAMAPVQEPKPKYVFDPGFETDTYYHEGNTEFIFPVRIKRSAQPVTIQWWWMCTIWSAMRDSVIHPLQNQIPLRSLLRLVHPAMTGPRL